MKRYTQNIKPFYFKINTDCCFIVIVKYFVAKSGKQTMLCLFFSSCKVIIDIVVYYRFTRHDFPTETSPITIAFAIFKDTRFVLHERLTIGSKSLSLYFVISDENGGGQLLT